MERGWEWPIDPGWGVPCHAIPSTTIIYNKLTTPSEEKI